MAGKRLAHGAPPRHSTVLNPLHTLVNPRGAPVRYAIYLIPPPGHPLTRAAEAWLGRSAFGHPVLGQTAPACASPHSAARYGFHATMRAPFSLASNQDEAALLRAFSGFCRAVPGLPTRLSVRSLSRFVALMSDDNARMRSLALSALMAFEPFRAPIDAAERARRGEDHLDPRGRTLLDRWGYAHTEERFVFHMTLSGMLSEPAITPTIAAANAALGAALAAPVPLAFALFVERARSAPFEAIAFAGRPL